MDLNAISFSFPGLEKVHCLFQTRHANLANSTSSTDGPGTVEGNISLEVGMDISQTVANRTALLGMTNTHAFAENRQVHGVVTIFEPQAQSLEHAPQVEADGLATSAPGFTLMIKTADCQPVMLAARDGSAVAALHVGWKGNRQGYPGIAVREFCKQYNLVPSDIMAVRGPSLGPQSAEFIHFDREWGQEFVEWYDSKNTTMNLWHLTRAQLVQAGLLPDYIFGIDMCTWTQTKDFFSFRRDRACGRQASLIWIEE